MFLLSVVCDIWESSSTSSTALFHLFLLGNRNFWASDYSFVRLLKQNKEHYLVLPPYRNFCSKPFICLTDGISLVSSFIVGFVEVGLRTSLRSSSDCVKWTYFPTRRYTF
jgi:hypothetical protein